MMRRVSGPLGNPTSAPALRATAPGWRDARLWVGLVIVAVCVIAGARILASADDTVAVWAAGNDLVAGSEVGADDVVAVRVRFRDDERLDAYLRADEPWDPDRALLRDVASGELIPVSSTGDEPDEQVRLLPVAVALNQVPAAVGAGSIVDVWAAGVGDLQDPADPASGTGGDGGTGGTAGAAPARSSTDALLVLEGVRVVDAPDASSQVGSVSERQLVLAVPDDQQDAIATALAALAAGTVTIAQRS